MKASGVGIAYADQCQYGSEVRHGPHRGSPVKKPSGFLSNAPKVLEVLMKQCEGRNGECSRPAGGRHVIASGRIAREAAVYPRELCRSVLRGITMQLRADRRMKPGCVGIQAVDDEEEIIKEIQGPAQGFSGKYRDDLTGQVLHDGMVFEARMKELEFFHSEGV